ncbi:Rpn family recombination-promoting nuclease/putative transposase [Acetatifactor muris]|uniref:Rpn family recombination-promoting nuclease/putative transposase n=1 Tax=Acetatifactor muris TaxID=879566 RepID=UPI0023F44592|nr:Rpn family recombination-promoting nuclease/putative transposase [Acetatifactor muris]
MKRKTTEVKSAERQPVKKGVAGVKRKGYGKSSVHNRDISSKDVFSNPVLCAQFLRDNFDIPFLQNVQPEDIEDISSRYHPYLGTEFESDSVQKIRILDIGKEKDSVVEAENEPPFLISLIDHKSLVDYDVAMQLLRYMMCIWTAYKKELEAKHEGITRRKEFRYPVIIPIVYFEGEAKWTAARNFRERISRESQFRKWIPDFRYELVTVRAYSNEELLNRGDEMSLIMLINKIQNDADLEQFLRLPADRLNQIVKDSPEHVIDIIVSAMESLCFKIDVSAEERLKCVRKVREREMGYLWENMEKISIQEERRKTEEQRKLAEEERARTEEQRKLAEKERCRADEAEEKLKAAEEMIRQLKDSIGRIE